MTKQRFILPTTIGTKATKEAKTPEGCGLVVYKGQSIQDAVEANKPVKKAVAPAKKPVPAKKPDPKAE